MNDQAALTLAARTRALQDQVKPLNTRQGKFSRFATTKTITAGVITADHHDHLMLLPETGTTDDLVTINGVSDGRRITLYPKTAGHSLTVKSTGNILVGADRVLSAQNHTLSLIYSDFLNKWLELSFNATGDGSGIDAETLDGLDSTAFSLAGHTHAYAPLVHTHAAGDIVSGTLDDARIPSTITRDSEVMTIVLANDGAGSGVDADLLDGLSSAAFALAGHSHAAGDAATLDGIDSTGFFILAGQAGGQSGHGGTAANEDLTLRGTSHATKTSSYILLQPDGGSVGIRTGAATLTGTLQLGGDTASIVMASDTTESGPFTLSVLGSGGATPATKGTGYGRNLIFTAGASDNTAGLAGGDLILRPGVPTAPATLYGDVIVADQGGNTYIADDTDRFANIGRARVGAGHYSDYAWFSHRDFSGDGQYALIQSSIGDTLLGALTGRAIYHRINNVDVMVMNATGLGIKVTPGRVLDVVGRPRVRSDGVGDTAGIWFADNGGTDRGFVGMGGDGATGPLGIYSHGAWRMYILSSGFIGIGQNQTSAQGLIHGHDGAGGFIFVSKTAVAGSAVSVIPNGAGDVTGRLYGMYTVVGSGGAASQGNIIGAVSGTDNDILNDGTNIVKLRVNADGSVDVRRTGGTQTYTVVLWLIWS